MLSKFGFCEYFSDQLEYYENNLKPARIIAAYKDNYKVITEEGESIVKLSGRLLNNMDKKSDFPTVGDWVILNKNIVITDILQRKSKISRKISGSKKEEQILAANVDTIFIVTSMNKEFNKRRIERYIAAAENSNAKPVIVLTKLDECDNKDAIIEEIEGISLELKVICTSSFLNIGITEIKNELGNGKTGVFIGSSGVGKSTLVNKLLCKEIQKTSEIREKDHKGRHTTSHRELFLLNDNSCIIDTPGIRELNLFINHTESSGFNDIEEIAYKCKFSNCKHINEPDCAVKEAIEKGELDFERFKSYYKLQKEIYYTRLKVDKAEKFKFKKVVKKQSKNERYTLKK